MCTRSALTVCTLPNVSKLRRLVFAGLPWWERGDDRVTLLEPRVQPLAVLAIAGADPSNVTAEAIVLTDYDQLALANVTGRIVVFAQP